MPGNVPTCPACLYPAEVLIATIGDWVPRAGSIVICGGCSRILCIGEDTRTMRVVKERELSEWPPGPRAMVLYLQAAVRNRVSRQPRGQA